MNIERCTCLRFPWRKSQHEPLSMHLPPISLAGNLQHEPLSMHLPTISLAGNLQHEPHSPNEDYNLNYTTELSINLMQKIRLLEEESKLQKEKIKQLIVFNKTNYDQNSSFRFVINDLLGNKNWNS